MGDWSLIYAGLLRPSPPVPAGQGSLCTGGPALAPGSGRRRAAGRRRGGGEKSAAGEADCEDEQVVARIRQRAAGEKERRNQDSKKAEIFSGDMTGKNERQTRAWEHENH